MLALGMFDGVHVGHQAVLNLAVEQAKCIGRDCGCIELAYASIDSLIALNKPLLCW